MNIRRQLKLALALACCSAFFSQFALSQSHKAVKIDKRFNATLYPRVFSPADEFVDRAELELTWWSLLGQPVYYNVFTWTIRDEVSVELDGGRKAWLSRKALSDHPDLLKQFNELKPGKIDIRFNVTLYATGQSGPEAKKASNVETLYDNGGSFSFYKTVKDVTLIIASSGQRGEGMSPGSPSYFEFMDMASNLRGLAPGESSEKRLSATFKAADSITFLNPEITRITIPKKQIRSIYETLRTRQSDCTKEENKNSAQCIKQAVKKIKDDLVKRFQTEEPEQSGSSEDDFWKNGTESTKTQAQGIEVASEPSEESSDLTDSFWANGGDSKKAPENQKQADAEFWSNGSSSVSQTDDSFWSGAGAVGEFKIVKSDDGKQGVVSSEGETLIPFRAWKIMSYQGGLAEVLETRKLEGECLISQNSKRGWAYKIDLAKQGIVDESGVWIDISEQSYKANAEEIYFSSFAGITLTSRSDHSNETASERRARKAREERYARKKEREEERVRKRERIAQDQIRVCRREINTKMESAISKLKNEGYSLD